MSHLEYYAYQATARGVRTVEDVARLAEQQRFAYEGVAAQWLPANKNARIVDLACGHGSFLFWLKERGHTNLAGVDSSPEQTRFAASVGIHIETADAIAWIENAPAASFDQIFGIDFIEHISKDDFMRVLKACSRALVPGGSLVLRYPNGDSPFVGRNLFNDITHIWTYTANCMNTLATMHGFRSSEFKDEGIDLIQQHRWIKVPLGRVARWFMLKFIQAATRERLETLHSNVWARLTK